MRRITRGHRVAGQAWGEEKAPACLIAEGKDFRKEVEVSGDHLACSKCGSIVMVDQRRVPYSNCRCWNGEAAYLKKTRTPEQARRWGADRFLKRIVH